MVLDIIIIALFALFVAAGAIKGAAKMIIGLVMTFAAFLAASWLGKLFSGIIYDTFCAPAVGRALESAASSTGDMAKELPWWAEKSLHLSGQQLSSGIQGSASQLTETVNSMIRPIAAGVIAILLTLVLFLIINLILHKLVMPPILLAFHVPVIRTVDRVIGALIGAVEGVAVICMLAYLLKLALPYIDSDVSFLNETTIYNSFIFYHFYSGNIFAMLTSWI